MSCKGYSANGGFRLRLSGLLLVWDVHPQSFMQKHWVKSLWSLERSCSCCYGHVHCTMHDTSVVLIGSVGNNGRPSSGCVRDHRWQHSVPCGRQLRDHDTVHVHVWTEPVHAGAGQDTSPQLSGRLQMSHCWLTHTPNHCSVSAFYTQTH